MSSSGRPPELLERIASGIAGLDRIIHGGFLRGGIYLISGPPGAGKTILANQMAFHHVAGGGRIVYMTLLAETHARMLAYLRPLAFFDPAPVGDPLYYVSGYRVLQEASLPGLLRLIQGAIRDRRATLLILDGVATAGMAAASDLDFKEFIHELQVYGEARGCTSFLLSPTYDDPNAGILHTMVDGLIELSDRRAGLRAGRELEVRKLRGTGYLRGRHFFAITDAGVVVYPRTESLPPTVLPATTPARRLGFGITRLDEMLQGGVLAGSTTLLLGPPGSGKTVLGLNFLTAGAEEQGLFFGFHETPAQLTDKARGIGLDLGTAVAAGQVEILWQPPLEHVADALAEQLLAAVRRRGVRRLVIDGLASFNDTAFYPERIGRFFVALHNELRALNVTTLVLLETRHLFGPALEVPVEDIAAVVENLIFVRYVELRSQLYRLISILKVRESGYDPAIREFTIGAGGIQVADTFGSAEAILTGMARPLSPRPGSGLAGESGNET